MRENDRLRTRRKIASAAEGLSVDPISSEDDDIPIVADEETVGKSDAMSQYMEDSGGEALYGGTSSEDECVRSATKPVLDESKFRGFSTPRSIEDSISP